MSERLLEVVRQPDGSYLATFDDQRPPADVRAWADIRALRARYRLNDHWADDDRAAFIEAHGHPFDDWWATLSAPCRRALLAEPTAAVPAEHALEIKRSLRHELGRDGLRVEGSFFSPEVRQYLADRAAAEERAATPER